MLNISQTTMPKLLSKMKKDDLDFNYELIELVFESINETNEYGENILHYFVSDVLYDEYSCFLAVKTLLHKGINPNHLDTCKYNFIQTAIDTGYSEDFIFACIKEAVKYGLDVNHQDEDGDTIIHNAIVADDYHDGISKILEILMENSYDPRIKNNNNKMIDDLVFESKKYTNEEKRKMISLIDKVLSMPENLKISKYNNKR